MTPIFAQSTDLPSVPAETLKWTLIVLVALLFIGACIAGLIKMFGKPTTKIDDNPPPEFRKAAKRYNHDASELRFGGIEGRLDGHDAELDRIWSEMRKEDTSIRETHAQNFAQVKTDLAHLGGTLDEVNKNVQLLLKTKVEGR
jgi:hypothetical protein